MCLSHIHKTEVKIHVGLHVDAMKQNDTQIQNWHTVANMKQSCASRDKYLKLLYCTIRWSIYKFYGGILLFIPLLKYPHQWW